MREAVSVSEGLVGEGAHAYVHGGERAGAQGKGLVLTGGEVRVEALLEIVIHKFKDEVETRRLRDDLWKGEGGGSSGGERRGACVVTYDSVAKARADGEGEG